MMTTEDIQRTAPSIFANEPDKRVTDQYTFIPTSRLLDDLGKLGWGVNRASQQKSHVDAIHTKHLIVMRNDSLPEINGNACELVIVNSHDRTASFRFMIGLFRMICSNGLIVSSQLFESLRIRHMGFDFEGLQELTGAMTANVPKLVKQINQLERATLTPKQQLDFAIRVLALRFPEYMNEETYAASRSVIKHAIDVPALLRPLRTEDEGDTVWLVFNRLQERIIKGGFQKISQIDDISRKVRPITNIGLSLNVNKAMWEMAEAYAN
jgi:hypothetical protein